MQHLAFLPVGLQVRDESGSTMSDLKSTGFQNKMELLIFFTHLSGNTERKAERRRRRSSSDSKTSKLLHATGQRQAAAVNKHEQTNNFYFLLQHGGGITNRETEQH